MSAREDYPFPAAVADGRVNGGAYGKEETAAALDEIDRLRAAVYMQGLTVQPGDTLIVRLAANITMQQAADYRALIVKKLPLLADVLVFNADEIAVYRP